MARHCAISHRLDGYTNDHILTSLTGCPPDCATESSRKLSSRNGRGRTASRPRFLDSSHPPVPPHPTPLVLTPLKIAHRRRLVILQSTIRSCDCIIQLCGVRSDPRGPTISTRLLSIKLYHPVEACGRYTRVPMADHCPVYLVDGGVAFAG